MVGDATGKVNVTKAGGGFGIVSVSGEVAQRLNHVQLTAALAGYVALAGLLTKDTSYFLLPVGDLSKKKKSV